MWTFHYPPGVTLVGLSVWRLTALTSEKIPFSPSEIASFPSLISAYSGTVIGKRWTSWFELLFFFFPPSLSCFQFFFSFLSYFLGSIPVFLLLKVLFKRLHF